MQPKQSDPISEIRAEAERVSAPLSQAEVDAHFGGEPTAAELEAFALDGMPADPPPRVRRQPALIPLELTPPRQRGKHYVEPRGYAAPPGTGPEGENCRGCEHYTHQGGVAGNYPKCAKNRARWTGGRGSDILASAPACRLFDAAS